ncbi:MAG: NAD(P)H-dependent oxidoreductase [Sphingobacteriaceae bacterium]|nr:NAD(P)H-dependent oxidoreductase [Sphingobacteriaceae bacterium]
MNYTIVASTSRDQSVSSQVAAQYQEILAELGVQARVLDLQDMPIDILETTLYKKVKQPNAAWEQMQEVVNATEKFVFVIPEYNGSFPGILKVWVDACKFPTSFKHKKAALLGISDGTQGSALAMGHFADVLNYAGTHTLALRPRLIQISKNMQDGRITNVEYLMFMRLQAEQLLTF